MRRLVYLPIALCALLLLLALPACGDSDGNGGDAQSSESSVSEVIPTGDCVPSTTEDDRAYRITNLNISQPASLGALQGLITSDIRDGLLDVLILVRDFQECEGGVMTFEVTGGAGKRHETSPDGADPTDAVYTWADDVLDVIWRPGVMQADRSFRNLENLDLVFPALLPADDPDEEPEVLHLPLKDIALNGGFATNDAGRRVIRGATSGGATLEGVILAEDVEDIEIALTGDPRPLASFLGSRNYPQGVDVDDRTGWRLRATVIAEEVEFIGRDE